MADFGKLGVRSSKAAKRIARAEKSQVVASHNPPSNPIPWQKWIDPDDAIEKRWNPISLVWEKTGAYDAIVSPDGSTSFSSLRSAIKAGKKNIFLKKGVYDENGSVFSLPSNINIIGEGKEDTIIKNCSINTEGTRLSASLFTSKRVQSTNGSTSVTGYLTDFVAAGVKAGDYLIIGSANSSIMDVAYRIASVSSDTNLTLKDYWGGRSGVNVEYYSVRPIENIRIENIKIEENTTIRFGYSRNTFINNITTKLRPSNIDIYLASGANGISWDFTLSNSKIGAQIFTSNNKVFNCSFLENELWMDNGFLSINGAGNKINNNTCISNNNSTESRVIDIRGTSNQVIGNSLKAATSSNANDHPVGIFLFGCSRSIIKNNSVKSYNTGISLNDSSNGNIIEGNVTEYAEKTGIKVVSGAFNAINNNVAVSNSGDGIVLTSGAARNILANNSSIYNSGIGIDIQSGVEKNIVTSNLVFGNGTAQISDNGTNTQLDNNITT